MNFGEKLRLLREDKGLSQKEVAEKLGVSLRTYSSYELNQRRPRTREKLEKMASFFGKNIDYLQIDDIGEKTENLEEYRKEELASRYKNFESNVVSKLVPFLQQLGWNVTQEARIGQFFRADLLATLDNVSIIFEFKLSPTRFDSSRFLYHIYGLASTINVEKSKTYFVVISNTGDLNNMANANPPVRLDIPIKFFTFNQESDNFNSPELFKFISSLSQ